MELLKKISDSMPFLLNWLNKHGDIPIRYRLAKEIGSEGTLGENVLLLRKRLESFPAARQILEAQKENGSWGGNFRGVALKESTTVDMYSGLEYQLSRLLEFGFDKKHPVVQKAADLLFMYLEEDRNAPLFEARHYLPRNPGGVKWYLRLMTTISAKLLSMAGYQDDERLKKWITAYASRLNEYLRSEKSKNPYNKFKGKYTVDEEIMLPGYHLIDLLAYNTWLRDGILGQLFLPKLFHYLKNFPSHPEDCPVRHYESIDYEFPDLYVRAGNDLYRGLGIPFSINPKELDTKYKNRIPAVIKQLEMHARLGLLHNDDPILEWLLSKQDESGIIIFSENLKRMVGRDTYHYYPLQSNMEGQRAHVDTTFRTVLIIHYLRTVPRIKD